MRLIEFFPNRIDRYIAAIARIERDDARQVGGTRHAVLVTIGYQHKLMSAIFEADPEVHHFLSWEKVQERFPFEDPHLMIVAYLVVAELLGRQPIGHEKTVDALTINLDWEHGWRDQLVPLIESIGKQ